MGVSLALVLGCAAGAVVLRRRQDESPADRARRRLGRLLLPVQPVDLTDVRLVDVESPDALARLAERYGLLVLHWNEGADAVFAVQDDATAYRWACPEQAGDAVPMPAPTDDAGAAPDGESADEAARLASAREAARVHLARIETARLEAERCEQARVEQAQARQRSADLAEQAQDAADRARSALREAERLEQTRLQEAERAASAWASLVPEVPGPDPAAAGAGGRERAVPVLAFVPVQAPRYVPTPRDGAAAVPAPTPRTAVARPDERLEDSPPRQAD